MARRKRKPRPRPLPPPPAQSSRIYIQIAPSDIAIFRFLMEAMDNLALFTVTDRFKGILLLRFSPHQKREFFEFMDGLKEEIDITYLPNPDKKIN
ncbi:DUF4911 domain-containing protein [Maridesulfovibrio hydrothermalis]|uniref:DUF4911 domain-containing protein n=1 Tax=Maridesulfovibrio hydrothermalis AM13 = DSM 14728 TaxID=1121451 RepID=L0RCM2_9BACT|nr:DUF4911 domain-containing protein [Maridesulfovibrio hydrothermalis]CCO23326.1 conserved protein of unknown function [Maridesulfovibrio hydrothermalis AM13 = DSM 14728]